MRVNNITNFDGMWIINENIGFSYSSSVDSEPLSTNTDVFNNEVYKIHSLSSFHASI